ncbi:MAG: A/G-specific adenine glycosylase [Gemmatimonadetes bacterium]|nr:A/G-specific adenine glycosylase [Gemmatimonadota bacterium]
MDFPTLRSRLLAWYDDARRDLPWRTPRGQAPDPYRVWLSEVMLQQTRVETVRPYYARWLERFPTVDALAAAPLDDVLKAWEGLGYYSRARNFHRAVQEVASRHGGRVPGEPDAFRALPGVGRYTAGAVMSIAFGREEPVVDGNVRRVFARWTDDPAPAEDALWPMAAALVPGERPGDVNQAVMELGATVCTPRSPRCGECPVRGLCAAYAAGTQNERPAPKKARPLPHEDTAVPVIHRGGEVLLVRRPVRARLGGMWGFPQAIRHPGESASAAAERAAAEGLDLAVRAGAPVASVDHTFTHVRATYHAVRCTVVWGEPRAVRYDEVAWVPWERIGGYALPVAQKRIAALAALHPTGPHPLA